MARMARTLPFAFVLPALACSFFGGPSAEELAATYVAQTQGAASPTSPATDTPVPPTATNTPPPTPTERPTPRPTPTLGPIIVRDDFSRNTGIWDCEFCSWRDGVIVMGPWPVSGAYQQQIAVCTACGEVRYFRMAVDVTYGSGPSERGFGLLMKWSEAMMMTAEVTAWQTVEGWKYDYARQRWEWLNGVFSGAVRPGRGTNRLLVEVAPAPASGRSTITLQVNGRNLVILYNQTGEPGLVGLTLYGHAVEVVFDNFEFEELAPYSGWQPPGPEDPSG
jgi:hypothetical protein